jgi:hypothetical protein
MGPVIVVTQHPSRPCDGHEPTVDSVPVHGSSGVKLSYRNEHEGEEREQPETP